MANEKKTSSPPPGSAATAFLELLELRLEFVDDLRALEIKIVGFSGISLQVV